MNKQLSFPIIQNSIFEKEKLIINLKKRIEGDSNLNIKKLMNKNIIFNNYGKEMNPICGWKVQPSLQFKNIPPINNKVDVLAIDSSCIFVAETYEGSIYASQVSIVFSNNSKLNNYIKIGPILYYIDEQEAEELSISFTNSTRYAKQILIDKNIAQRIIRDRLEKIVAFELVKMLSGVIILIDGCLKSSKFPNNEYNLNNILKSANNNQNIIIGISKTSKVKLINNLLQTLYSTKIIPSYIDISPFFPAINPDKRIVLARFSKDGHPYRIDISNSDVQNSLSLLITSDLLYRGYPETLRIAHHLSIFSTICCYSIKSYLIKKAHLNVVPAEDIRKITLGNIKF